MKKEGGIVKKIPTLFERVYEDNKIVDVLPNVAKYMEWVLNGEGVATEKIDGTCCAIINRKFYKRYDAKNGKTIPEGAIKCQEEADPITGHFPCWVRVDANNPSDKWFRKAYYISSMWGEQGSCLKDGTYEAIGEHFNGNPYKMDYDMLVPHGKKVIEVERTFDGIKKYLSEHYIEGIVFWKDGEPRCKIKRSDFGFDWNK